MLIEQLDALIQSEPFVPFTIHMADGRSHYVKHPKFISHSPNGRVIILFQKDNSFSLIRLNLVTECHEGKQGKSSKRSPKNGNGAG